MPTGPLFEVRGQCGLVLPSLQGRSASTTPHVGSSPLDLGPRVNFLNLVVLSTPRFPGFGHHFAEILLSNVHTEENTDHVIEKGVVEEKRHHPHSLQVVPLRLSSQTF